MREYLYFSQRLAKGIVEDNSLGRTAGAKTTLSFRPGGVGGDVTWGGDRQLPETRHEWAEAVDAVIGDQAAWGWDPNEAALFLRGRSQAFLGELVGGPHPTGSAMVGATYLADGLEVNLCLFGSRHNLDGTVPDVDPSRRKGWFSSSTVGVRQLLTLVPRDANWDEERAFPAAGGVDDDDLVWSAANIMRGQGMVGDGNRAHAEAPSLRGFTVLEGDFEWLARIYWWRSGDPQFHNVAVGAPVYVRTASERPWTVYEPLDGRSLDELQLTPGRMSPDMVREAESRPPGRSRPWWWPV
jgi:hypothetical protein